MGNRRMANFYNFFFFEYEYKHDIKPHLIFISNHMKYPFLKPKMDKVLIKWKKKSILEESTGDGSFVELALK